MLLRSRGVTTREIVASFSHDTGLTVRCMQKFVVILDVNVDNITHKDKRAIAIRLVIFSKIHDILCVASIRRFSRSTYLI